MSENRMKKANRSNNSKKNFSRNRNRSHRGAEKSLGINAILDKYDKFLEQYLTARKRYFDLFFRANQQQKTKLKRILNQSIDVLRKFEKNLRPWQLEFFNKKHNIHPEDNSYANNNPAAVDMATPPPLDNQHDDPHMLESQIISKKQYRNDTEESVGSLGDYTTAHQKKSITLVEET